MNAVEEVSTQWRLASQRLKDELYYLWYLLKHILASKFTYLIRGILRLCSAEILAQCETKSDISFDLAQIREGAGLGYADDLLDSAFAASKIASLRIIEQVDPGFLDSVKVILEAATAACQDSAFSLPARQLASSLLVSIQLFFRTTTRGRITLVFANFKVCFEHRKRLREQRSHVEALIIMSPTKFRTAFQNRLFIFTSPVVDPYNSRLWSGRGRPGCPYPEVPARW